MVIEERLKRLIANYNSQLELYEQMLLLSRQVMTILTNQDGYQSIDSIGKILDQRMEHTKTMEKYQQENEFLQTKVNASLGINQFTFSNVEGKIDSDTFSCLKKIIINIGEKLSLINETDYLIQTLLEQFVSQAQVTESTNNQTNKAVKAYQQAFKQQKTDNNSIKN